LFDFFLKSFFDRSPVPSEKLAPRYKENAGNAALLTTACPDFTDSCRGSCVGWFAQMQAACLPLRKR